MYYFTRCEERISKLKSDRTGTEMLKKIVGLCKGGMFFLNVMKFNLMKNSILFFFHLERFF